MKKYPEPKKFTPKNPEKYVGKIDQIVMRSSWEVKFARWCDMNAAVTQWGSETKPIPYLYKVDQKVHRYFPDFFVILEDKDGKRQQLIVEIKPAAQTQPPKTHRKQKQTILNEALTYQKNMDKWTAAQDYAKKIGWTFIILTEKELGIKR